MMFWNVPIVDPILSILFTSYILYNVAKTLRSTMHLFLQGVPAGIKLDEMTARIAQMPGVKGTHDLHIWSLDGASHVLTVHIVVASGLTVDKIQSIKRGVREIVSGYGEIHPTIEVEMEGEECLHLNCVD
jgi:cobalt-zinc-cadmium efflux system protein